MSINNKYEEAKIRGYLYLLQEAARQGNSLKESSDMAKKTVGRNYADYSKKIDDGVKKKAESAEKPESTDKSLDSAAWIVELLKMLKNIDAEKKSDKPAEKPAASMTDKTEEVKSVKHQMDEYISGISIDWKAGIVKLKFKDGQVTSAKCHPDDDFDLMVGISLCFTRWVFGDLSTAIENLLGF